MDNKFNSFNLLIAELCCTALFDKETYIYHNHSNDYRFTNPEMNNMLLFITVEKQKARINPIVCLGIQGISYNADGSFKITMRFYSGIQRLDGLYTRNKKYCNCVDTVIIDGGDLFSTDFDNYKTKVIDILLQTAKQYDFPPGFMEKVLGANKPFPDDRLQRYNEVCQRFVKEAVKQSSYLIGFVNADGFNTGLFDYKNTTVSIQWPFMSDSQIIITEKNKIDTNNYLYNCGLEIKETISNTSFTDSKISIFSRYSKENFALEFQRNKATLPTPEETPQEQINTSTTESVITPMKNTSVQTLLKLVNIHYTEDQNTVFFDKTGAHFNVLTKDKNEYGVIVTPTLEQYKDHTYLYIRINQIFQHIGFITDELETVYDNLVCVAVGIGWPEELTKSVFRQYKETEVTKPVKSSEDSFKNQAAKLIRKVTALVEVRGCYIFGTNDWVYDIVVINKKNNTFTVLNKRLNDSGNAEFLLQENIATVFKEEADRIKKACEEKLHELTYQHFNTLEEAVKAN